ncbi:hypothetical protein EGH67_26260 [Klebsiella aerogenes]|jgi:hypothetical protein|uniref:Uncharacterized protein n=1 Tax=Klebsiella aerogenes (strain ATCC 13048 / DSM 30053 / CCUG 1429 / JCM 1235 / KCTC 2190 / NBRC 13534 / NCIMB 10102 / NCTC 10006 / CDC 819-56) TaxID=1028307 RepID=A0A0H3FMM2_KLEAK|nr:hypothetical protein EAE_08790 [Klebsiella aerogenes KCTC 2190]ATM89439.1 hypothetical protein CRN78_02340 [Klebsiella aerogenes]CCG32229.1 hypothetical protein [Klebsiella aerogenes EA1509E]ATX85896.1 hypothetical protein AM345_02995 [Klebsiella aerogenes]ATY05812.1 hypothetical protein AM336_09740 [Klebsiella aerogenes]
MLKNLVTESLDQAALLSVGQMRKGGGEKWRKLDAVGGDGVQ